MDSAVDLIKIFLSWKIFVFVDVIWVSFENGYRFVFDCLLLRVLMLNVVENCVFGGLLHLLFRLESMYRMWIRDRSDGFNSEMSDELRRELHTAVGTAKWQVGFCHPCFSREN